MLNSYILSVEHFFWLFAITGTALFGVRFTLMLIGLGENHGVDSDGHSDIDFKILSMHSLTGFFMIFGWAGLSAMDQFHYSFWTATLIAFICGIIAIYILKIMFSAASKLTSRGHVFNIKDAVGKIGTVYQRIPHNGAGKIIVSVSAVTHEIEAFSEDLQEIPSFVKIKVVEAISANKVTVRRIN